MRIILNSLFGIAGLIIAVLLYMFAFAKRRNVISHSYTVGKEIKQGKELSLFFISDIHRRHIDRRLLEKVKSYGSIDIVVIGGDLAEAGVPLPRIERNIRALSTLGPLFFIWGNNDREVGEDEIRKIISRHGGVILDNTDAAIPNNPLWGICGTDDPSSGRVDIKATLKNAKSYPYLIVAAHNPYMFRKIEEVCSPDLMLAGHTHGGQIRMGKFSLHALGRFSEQEGKAKLVSNGYGTSIVPLRLGAAPESHVIKINY
ncbi:metallophosphoesterase [Sporosarcina thermotolerans]|uniref:Metallophosphoesterase n=1 Tax=Sporosarcina thermotolerans TaxID=633404 RepID=A0AAW9A622_9BACL|nr:metallophosphoesterase [Sporosarcina thermotolerans]MDW0115579.1 metallophosphoesterase [Sporosarcina thermotolerans]WHT47123.1 metallophosphoesterase [Sporosarcina thermotolerans]